MEGVVGHVIVWIEDTQFSGVQHVLVPCLKSLMMTQIQWSEERLIRKSIQVRVFYIKGKKIKSSQDDSL